MHRIYVAGPYSSDPNANTERANRIAIEIMRRGHLAHCPHTATFGWEAHMEYEHIMKLDISLLQTWATALFYMGSSPGADMELAESRAIGLPVFYSLSEIDDIRQLAD